MFEVIKRRSDGSVEYCRGKHVEIEIDAGFCGTGPWGSDYEQFFATDGIEVVNPQNAESIEWDVFSVKYGPHEGPAGVEFFRAINNKMLDMVKIHVWEKVKESGFGPWDLICKVPSHGWLVLTAVEGEQTLFLDCSFKVAPKDPKNTQSQAGPAELERYRQERDKPGGEV